MLLRQKFINLPEITILWHDHMMMLPLLAIIT